MFLEFKKRAENGTRTRDPNLGKVVLYQLSYCRIAFYFCEEEETRTPTTQLSLPPQSSASTNSATSPISIKALNYSHLLCPEQDSNLHASRHTHLKRARLPIPPPGQKVSNISKRAENETRTRDPNLGKVMLYQLSYFRVFSTGAKISSFLLSAKLFPKKKFSKKRKTIFIIKAM